MKTRQQILLQRHRYYLVLHNAAGAALRHLEANLDACLKPTTATGSRLVFQDCEKKSGVITVAGKRMEIRLHLTTPPA